MGRPPRHVRVRSRRGHRAEPRRGRLASVLASGPHDVVARRGVPADLGGGTGRHHRRPAVRRCLLRAADAAPASARLDVSPGGTTDPIRLPELEIVDAPRFPWRGVLLDVARHFMPKSFVLELIDLIALHKCNVLHLHLTDDQGWRIESRATRASPKSGRGAASHRRQASSKTRAGIPLRRFLHARRSRRDRRLRTRASRASAARDRHAGTHARRHRLLPALGNTEERPRRRRDVGGVHARPQPRGRRRCSSAPTSSIRSSTSSRGRTCTSAATSARRRNGRRILGPKRSCAKRDTTTSANSKAGSVSASRHISRNAIADSSVGTTCSRAARRRTPILMAWQDEASRRRGRRSRP